MSKFFAVLVILLVILAGCGSGPIDTTALNIAKVAQTTANAAQATIAQQAATIATLSADINALKKAQTASDNRSATFATKGEVTAQVNASLAPKEWVDVKARVATLDGQVANYQSRQTAFEANFAAAVNRQNTRVNETLSSLGTQYATKGELLVIQAQIDAINQRLTAAGIK